MFDFKSPSEPDMRFLQRVFDTASILMAAFGRIDPFAIIETKRGTFFLQSTPWESEVDKSDFIFTIQLASVALEADRCAMATESWHVPLLDPENENRRREYGNGSSISELPGAREVVTVVIETDHGQWTSNRLINRLRDDYVELASFEADIFFRHRSAYTENEDFPNLMPSEEVRSNEKAAAIARKRLKDRNIMPVNVRDFVTSFQSEFRLN